MATRLVVQDNNKFGLYSTVSDTIYAINCSKEEIIAIWVEKMSRQAEEDMVNWISNVDSGRGVISLEDALDYHIFENLDDDKFNEQILSIKTNKRKSPKF